MEQSKSAEKWLAMPVNIMEEGKNLIDVFRNTPGIDPKITDISDTLLEGICTHEINQARLSTVWKEIKAAISENRAIVGDVPKLESAKYITSIFESRREYRNHLINGVSLLEELLADLSKLETNLQALQNWIAAPQIALLKKYTTGQRNIYANLKGKFESNMESMNSCHDSSIPGEEYGLKPFEDIVLSEDGHVLLWNPELEDWDFPEDFHPCRQMAGSSWGKFHYDMTPGEFFLKDQRQFIEWTHPSVSKKLLDHLEETHLAVGPEVSEQVCLLKEYVESKLQAPFWYLSADCQTRLRTTSRK